jgi:hypothetical protein
MAPAADAIESAIVAKKLNSEFEPSRVVGR